MPVATLVHSICGKPLEYVSKMPPRAEGDAITVWHLRCPYCDADFTSNDTGEYDFV